MEEDCDDRGNSSDDDTIKLSKDEIKLMNTYTWDKEPVKAWRHNSDYRVLRECNEYRWYEISEFLGKFSGFTSSIYLYKKPSKLCNLIETLICPNKCYFQPKKCFLEHGSTLKDLMKQSLHSMQGPEFRVLFDAVQKPNLKIEHDKIGRPMFDKLAEEIGFNTVLDYDEEGFLKVDYSVLDEKIYEQKRPSFIVEEKKVLDIIHALLIVSQNKRTEEFLESEKIYLQNLQGLNDPVLKTMCFGPFPEFEQNNLECNLSDDEKNVFPWNNVEHSTCVDIKVDKKVLFHNNELLKNGRNYRYRTVKFAGLKVNCKKCRENTKDHLINHLTFHMQCKHCIHESRVMFDKDFWGKVCNICGKLFETVNTKLLHMKRYNIPIMKCDLCEVKCSSKFNLTRHMIEQHDTTYYHTFEMGTQEPSYLCEECEASFKYKRNLLIHVQTIHKGEEQFTCQICKQEIRTKRKLTRHLQEQHEVFSFEDVIKSKETEKYFCELCELQFTRKENLERHMESHASSSLGEKYTCDECGKQFTTKFNLSRHQAIHTGSGKRFQCDICHKSFTRKGHLARHVQGVHKKP